MSLKQSLKRFPDVSGLLEAIGTGAAASWNGTDRLPGEVPDHERKYYANDDHRSIPERQLGFQALIHSLSSGDTPVFTVMRSEKFAGIDEAFEFEGADGSLVTHRLRFGSNRPCQWSTKSPSQDGDGTERQRSSVSIAYRDFENTRTQILRTSRTVHKVRHLIIGQSGEFWFVKDQSGYHVEIALYKAGRAEADATTPLLLLAEIAPRRCPSLEIAVELIEKYEELLHLKGRRVQMANVELFREK